MTAAPSTTAGMSRIEERMFFFEKKNQKAFLSGAHVATGADRRGKSLLLLFFRKEVLP
jgi:hypothetical protein